MIMVHEIPFYKMVASGNDFVVVDNRKKIVTDAGSFAKKVCERHNGIGGDGVLLIENVGAAPRGRPSEGHPQGGAHTDKIDYRVRIINADGSEAEACGNGFRCISLLANQRFGFSNKQRFESLAGIVDSDVKGTRVRVRLMDPKDYRERKKIEVSGRELNYHFIRVGVPHVVIFVEGLSKIPVCEIGKAVRFHPEFGPAGTNVNFVEVAGDHSIHVETYERGVEENTQACGTGSTASAIVSSMAGYVEAPVQVKTRGGEILKIDFQKKGKLLVQDVYLEGEARFVYEGKIVI